MGGDDAPNVDPQQPAMPEFLRKTSITKKIGKGLTLCLVKMLDGQTLQLYADPNTTGQQLLDQSLTLISVDFV